MRKRLAIFVAMCACIAALPAASASQAQGQLTLEGKTIKLQYAYAASGPDTFEGTQQAYLVLLSEKPLAKDAIQKAQSFLGLGGTGVGSLLDSGMMIEIHPDKSYHLTVRHPALQGKEIQESANWGLEIKTLGPDRVAGTFASSSSMMGKGQGDGGVQEIGMGHKAKFKVQFDAPVERHFPLEPKYELSSSAKKLPAGGGEQGKIWIAEACKPVPALPAAKDPKSIEKFLKDQGMTDKDLQQEMDRQSKLKGHTVTRDEALKGMAEMMSAMGDLAKAMALSNCKVLSGSADDKVAILQVEATQGGVKQKTDVTLAKEGNAWTVKKTGAWRSP